MGAGRRGSVDLLTVRKGKFMNNQKNIQNNKSFSGGGKTPTEKIWRKIKLEMIALILQNDFDYDKVFSIAEMTKRFGCGKSTAQKVLESLVKEKVLTSIKGVGFFVNKKDENLQERLKMEYQAAIDQALDDYLTLCKNIGMSKEDMIAAIEKRIQGGNDDGTR